MRGGFATAGTAAAALACCALMPLVLVAAAGASLGALLGSAGIVLLVCVAGLAVAYSRKRSRSPGGAES